VLVIALSAIFPWHALAQNGGWMTGGCNWESHDYLHLGGVVLGEYGRYISGQLSF